ncbi:MAG TPA: lactonase family protein [Puia sp.]|nr:lactonase family protein [Puia sp.]
MRLSILFSLLLFSLSGISQSYYLFAGTYTNADSKGIYVYRFNSVTGEIVPVSTAASDNPSYLAIAPGGSFIYAANESGGAGPGAVSAYSFNKATGQLTFLDKQSTGGNGTCYISVDSKRKWVMAANYGGGSLAALPVNADGSVAPMTEFIQHSGQGINPQRQEKPHVHSAIFSPDEHFLLVADLGLDKLSVYNFNPDASPLPLAPLPSADSNVNITPGSGPRHTSFFHGKPYVYLISEMAGMVDAFKYSGGKFTPFQRISSHPAGYNKVIGSADIHISPNNKFLYVSNRGDANNIAIFAIDQVSGKLTAKGFQSVLGNTPRNFIIDPTGRWLLVANQRSNNIVIFRIDPKTGLLKPLKKQVTIPSPVCLKMYLDK